MLAFVEAFWVMGVVFLLMIPFLPMLEYAKRKQPSSLREPRPEADRTTSESQSPWTEPQREEVSEEEHQLVLH